MEGPYEDYKEPDKVAAILGWVTKVIKYMHHLIGQP